MKQTLWHIAMTAIMPVLLSAVLTSCIKDEPLNCEADIETVTLHVANPELVFFQTSDTTQAILSTDTVITFTVRSGVDVSAMAPELTLTQGATVSPASGSVHDFSQGAVHYTVTSQDGNWQRHYTIAIVPTTVTVTDTVSYDFESYELEPTHGHYYIWHNELADGTLGNDWATANPGFRLSMSSAQPDEYPTTPLVDGYDGAALCLTTRDTGPFGKLAGKRLAAGNFYLGTFDVSVATTNALQATCFGIPFTDHPVRFTGYYRYMPGETFQDPNGNTVAGRVDSAAVYAVLYRNHDAQGNSMVLHGDDVLSNPNIVALAKVPYVAPTSQWTAWDITFDYYTAIDDELLVNRGYNLAIVFSSSASGATFEGAVGSTLHIDKVRLICTHNQ